MAYLAWNESMSVENGTIDNQHKEWITTIDDFYQGIKDGSAKERMQRLLKSMKDYTVFHFSEEEQFMRRINFPETDKHIELHKKFVEKVDAFADRFNSGKLLLSIEVTNFMKEWVVNHIMTVDKKYAEFARKQ